MINELLNSERLVLRPLIIEDSKRIFEIYSNPKVAEHFDIEPYKSFDEAQSQIEKWIKLNKEKKQFRFAITLDDSVIGTCGIYSIYTEVI